MPVSPVEFVSEGAILRGRLYSAPAATSRPLVIMTHGFSATITGMVAERYAEAFHEAGLAVLLFDHRGFGLSDGSPRLEIDAFRQAREYTHAVDYALGLPGIDPARIGLWGDSLSAGAAVAAAAVDDRVAAVVAQVPALGSDLPAADPDGAAFDAACRPFLARQPAPYGVSRRGPMPVVSSDQMGTPSLLTPVTAYRWFIEYGGRPGTGWENRASLLVAEEPARWRPALAAAHVHVPTMFVIAPADEMPGAEPDVTRAAFERVPATKECLEIEGGHFGLLEHPGRLFDKASQAEARFLTRRLAGRAVEVSGDRSRRPAS